MKHYLNDYAYLTTKNEVDQAIERHLEVHSPNMNSTDRALLNLLHVNAEDFGAVQVTYRTIENAIGRSNATVRRTIRKLMKLEIIDRVHYILPGENGLGANIYVIKPFEAN